MPLRLPTFLIAYLALASFVFPSAIVTVDESDRLRALLRLQEDSPQQRYALQLSSDLRQWTTYPLRFDAEQANWSLQAEGDVSLFSESNNGDGTWSLAFSVLIQDAVYLRLAPVSGPFPVDPRATAETQNLLKNLHRIGWDPDRYIFGQEFPLSFNSTDNIGNGDIEQSESKDVVGDHPGVHGADFLYLIDQPWHDAFHIAAAKRAYANGAIVTFDYHWPGKYGGNYQAHPEDDKILDFVVRNDDSRGDVTWFYDSLDRILALINEDLQFPIVFRPFHEMDGNWFWWGRQMQGGAATYRQAYQLLVDYMSERTDYLLFCWGPDVALADFEQFYPGDAYVDIVGRDIYNVTNPGRPLSKLTEMIAFAEQRGKVAAFTETGYAGSGSFETNDPDWWTTHILNPIAADENAGKIAWVLTWINASWSGPYLPHSGSPQAAKDDFKTFYESPSTLFQQEVSALNVYDAPTPND